MSVQLSVFSTFNPWSKVDVFLFSIHAQPVHALKREGIIYSYYFSQCFMYTHLNNIKDMYCHRFTVTFSLCHKKIKHRKKHTYFLNKDLQSLEELCGTCLWM